MPITKNKFYLQIHYLCIYKMRILMTGGILHLDTILLLYDTIHSYTDNTFWYALGHHQVWLQKEKRLHIYFHSVRRQRSRSFTINCNITIVYNILHMLILPSNAQDWHLHLHIRAYLNEPLGLQATSGSWKENKPIFWKRSLFLSVPWWQDQTWFSKQWFSHLIQMIAHGGFIAFSHHESFRLPHTPIHTTHIFVCMFTIQFSHDSSHCITIITKPITHPSNTALYVQVYKSTKCTRVSLWSRHHHTVCKN